MDQLELVLDVDRNDILCTSAKTGEGIDKVLPAIVESIPPPKSNMDRDQNTQDDGFLKAMLFDSWYDAYRGIICLIQVIEGKLEKGDKILFINSRAQTEVLEVGFLS